MYSQQIEISYLANHKQGTKVGSSYGDWFEFIRGIPQGSILGPLIIQYIYLLMTFFEIQKSNICNFANGSTFWKPNLWCDKCFNLVQN